MSRSVFFIGHRQRGKTTASVEFIKRELLTIPSFKKLFVLSDNSAMLRYIENSHDASLETNLLSNVGHFSKINYIGLDSLEEHNVEDEGNKIFFFPAINWDNPIVQKHIGEMYCPDYQLTDINSNRAHRKKGDLYVFELGITDNVHILV